MSITCARLSAAHNNSTKTAAVATQIFITGTPAARECERVRRCSLQKRLCILHATRVCRWAARSASRLQAVMNPYRLRRSDLYRPEARTLRSAATHYQLERATHG